MKYPRWSVLYPLTCSRHGQTWVVVTLPLSEYQQQRIISLWIGGGVTEVEIKVEIRRTLAREGVFTTHQTITNTITRWQVTGSDQDRAHIGQVKAIPPAHCSFIDAAMANNHELTASDLKMLLAKEFREEKAAHSERTVARARNALGWTFTTAR